MAWYPPEQGNRMCQMTELFSAANLSNQIDEQTRNAIHNMTTEFLDQDASEHQFPGFEVCTCGE